MIDPAASIFPSGAVRQSKPCAETRDQANVSVGRVTKGVAMAIGRSLTVERDAALPDSLASLVERLQAGPLGQTQLKSRRVA